MHGFFKTMQRVAATDETEYTSIMELTKEIAIRAGYSREPFLQKNGKTRVRTVYKNKWDDVLVAKWFMFYKNYMVSQLLKMPSIKEYYVDILSQTFEYYFKALQLDKLTSDKAVTAYVKLNLSSKIGNTLYYMGSVNKLDKNRKVHEYREKVKNGEITEVDPNKMVLKCRDNLGISHNAISIDLLKEAGFTSVEGVTNGEIDTAVIDLKNILNTNEYGVRLLEVMLNTNQKVVLGNIGRYMKFKDDELELRDGKLHIKQEITDKLQEAYVEISRYLKTFYPEKFKNKIKKPTISYSSSKANCITL